MVTKNAYIKGLLIFISYLFIYDAGQAQNSTTLINKANTLVDTSNNDTSKQAITPTDSSKLFINLLSSSNSKNDFNVLINPEAKLFVDEYIRTHTAYLKGMKIWGKPYFDLYDKILAAYGIPIQLKYLSVIESSLNSAAISWAGAVGPWQMMAAAAREYGLRTGNYDDRFDYIKSTNAAARMLNNLFGIYKDWLLVIAAYNCGTANVNRAIVRAHSANFWRIQYYLPEETRNHVKKFIATHYYFEGNGSIATLTADEAKNYSFNRTGKNGMASLVANCTSIDIVGKYNSVVIANTLIMDLSVFNELNPGLDDSLAKGTIYTLHLPADKAATFQVKKLDILKQSVELYLSSANAAPVKTNN